MVHSIIKVKTKLKVNDTVAAIIAIIIGWISYVENNIFS